AIINAVDHDLLSGMIDLEQDRSAAPEPEHAQPRPEIIPPSSTFGRISQSEAEALDLANELPSDLRARSLRNVVNGDEIAFGDLLLYRFCHLSRQGNFEGNRIRHWCTLMTRGLWLG